MMTTNDDVYLTEEEIAAIEAEMTPEELNRFYDRENGNAACGQVTCPEYYACSALPGAGCEFDEVFEDEELPW